MIPSARSIAQAMLGALAGADFICRLSSPPRKTGWSFSGITASRIGICCGQEGGGVDHGVIPRVAGMLERAGVSHALIGGMAVGALVEPRATKDIDLVVGTDTARAPVLVEAARAEGFHADDDGRGIKDGFEAALGS